MGDRRLAVAFVLIVGLGFGAAGEKPPAALDPARILKADAEPGAHDVRSGSGAWGVLTLGAMDRRAAFEVALIAALAPFSHAVAYR
jgi:hypothetical protein